MWVFQLKATGASLTDRPIDPPMSLRYLILGKMEGTSWGFKEIWHNDEIIVLADTQDSYHCQNYRMLTL